VTSQRDGNKFVAFVMIPMAVLGGIISMSNIAAKHEQV
jgi:hypothetical protein